MMKRRPSRLPEANWDWTSPEEVCKNALAAFYGASRHTAAQHAQDPENRAFPDQFIREVTEAFQLRLQAAAHFAGIGDTFYASTLAGKPPPRVIDRNQQHAR